uniref:Ig-like domain-containing protein n=1 Tax=Macrostomum lignano TaxID=282301 RepID=A0A1I8FHF5_9PLAT
HSISSNHRSRVFSTFKNSGTCTPKPQNEIVAMTTFESLSTNSGATAQTALCAVNPPLSGHHYGRCRGGSFLCCRWTVLAGLTATATSGRPTEPVLDIQCASEDCTAKALADWPGSVERRSPLISATGAGGAQQAGADTDWLLVWNADRQLVMREIAFPDAVLSCSFSWTARQIRLRLSRPSGSAVDAPHCRVMTACISDDASYETKTYSYLSILWLQKRTALNRTTAGVPHALRGKPVQVVCLRDGRRCSAPDSPTPGGRQLALWDGDSLASSIGGAIWTTSAVAAGDCAVRYYELTDESPHLHYLGVYRGAEPCAGVGAMPKRGLRSWRLRNWRLYLGKRQAKAICQPISFHRAAPVRTVPARPVPGHARPGQRHRRRGLAGRRREQPLLMPARMHRSRPTCRRLAEVLTAPGSAVRTELTPGRHCAPPGRRTGADLREPRSPAWRTAAAAAAAGKPAHTPTTDKMDKMVETMRKTGSFESDDFLDCRELRPSGSNWLWCRRSRFNSRESQCRQSRTAHHVLQVLDVSSSDRRREADFAQSASRDTHRGESFQAAADELLCGLARWPNEVGAARHALGEVPQGLTDDAGTAAASRSAPDLSEAEISLKGRQFHAGTWRVVADSGHQIRAGSAAPPEYNGLVTRIQQSN